MTDEILENVLLLTLFGPVIGGSLIMKKYVDELQGK